MKNILNELNQTCRNTLVETLGIEFIAIGEDWLEAKMPIDHRTMRPDGLLHGGANLALAETIGGALGFISVKPGFDLFGIEVNGNHMRQARGAYVTAKGFFIHKGNRTQVVNVEVRDEAGTLVTVSRVTNVVIPKTEE